VSGSTTITVLFPAPTIAIDTSSAKLVTLNQQITVKGLATNTKSCSFAIVQWYSKNKEFQNTVKPSFTGDPTTCTGTFAPGSTPPCATAACDSLNTSLWALPRTAVLKVEAIGQDGSTVSAMHTVTLQYPVLAMDSTTPHTMVAGKCVALRGYGHTNTFTSSNGVDYRGTVLGFSPDTASMITNVDQFVSPNEIATGYCVSPGGALTAHHYFANSGRPEAALMFTLEVTATPSSSISTSIAPLAPLTDLPRVWSVPMSSLRP
jgi:hypothetical protein